MRKILAVAGLATLTAGAIAIPAAAKSENRALTTKLSGAEEAPGPGDPDGKGHATIRIRGDDTVLPRRRRARPVGRLTVSARSGPGPRQAGACRPG